MFQRASAQDWKAEDHAIRHFGHHLPKSEAILCPDCLFRCKSTYFSDKLLEKLENPQIIHYGHYETVFFRKMRERYSHVVNVSDKLIEGAVNLLSVIYSQVYFPTYSNSLKEIAKFMDFQWSENDATGLSTLLWRSEWEHSRDLQTVS